MWFNHKKVRFYLINVICYAFFSFLLLNKSYPYVQYLELKEVKNNDKLSKILNNYDIEIESGIVTVHEYESDVIIIHRIESKNTCLKEDCLTIISDKRQSKFPSLFIRTGKIIFLSDVLDINGYFVIVFCDESERCVNVGISGKHIAVLNFVVGAK